MKHREQFLLTPGFIIKVRSQFVVVVCGMKTLLVCVHAYLRISPYPIASQQKEDGLNSV